MNYSSATNKIWTLTFYASSIFQSGDRIGLRGYLVSPNDVIRLPVITTVVKNVKSKLNPEMRLSVLSGLKNSFHYNEADIQLYLTRNSRGTSVLRSKTNGELRARGLDGHGGSRLKHSDGCWVVGDAVTSYGVTPIKDVCKKLSRLGICDDEAIIKITTDYRSEYEVA